jgi:hypothetical protein
MNVTAIDAGVSGPGAATSQISLGGNPNET